MKRILVTLVVAGMTAVPALGDLFYLSVDVPTTLGGVTFTPWDIVRNDSGPYSLTASLPPGTRVNGLHRLDRGGWLLTVALPATLGGTAFTPRDVIRWDGGGSFTLFLDGAAAGVPPGSVLDAVYLTGGDGGAPVVSFDAPTTIGGITFRPADLAQYAAGSFTRVFDAVAAGIPPGSDVTGADRRGPFTVMTFDVPTTVGATTFLPGELVSWNGAVLASSWIDPAWPPGSIADALAFLADPGRVPPTLMVQKWGASDLRLSWDPSCSAGAEDYGIHEGRLGAWYSHRFVDCSDAGGNFTELIPSVGRDRYYLVVPLNPNNEGSYGFDGSGAPRPTGAPSCVPSRVVSPCP